MVIELLIGAVSLIELVNRSKDYVFTVQYTSQIKLDILGISSLLDYSLPVSW
jgi:hypothetical protein